MTIYIVILADFSTWGYFRLWFDTRLGWNFFWLELPFTCLRICDDTRPDVLVCFNDNRLAGYTLFAWHSLAIARLFFYSHPRPFACTKFFRTGHSLLTIPAMRAFDAQRELARRGFHTRLDLDMLHSKGANEEVE
jgi:hypothetical protein